MAGLNHKRIPLRALVVAAYGPELKNWIQLGRRHFVIKNDVAFLQAGIGPVAAAFGLTHFLEDHAPQKIIAVGSAGTFAPKKIKIGSIVQARVVTSNAGLVESEICGPNLISLRMRVQSLPRVRVYAPQAITRSPDLATALAKHHDVEQLESFAYAFVAKKFQVPLHVILGISNSVSPQGKKEWQIHEANVMRKVAKTVERAFLI